MKTPFIALLFVALIGLGVMAIAGLESSTTGQGTKIIRPTEAMKKAMEKEEKPYGSQEYFTLNECMLFREIYKLRQELKLPTDHLDFVKNICTYSDWW